MKTERFSAHLGGESIGRKAADAKVGVAGHGAVGENEVAKVGTARIGQFTVTVLLFLCLSLESDQNEKNCKSIYLKF